MGFQINTNVSALSAYRNLSNTQDSLTNSLEKLSSGLRINRAGDDAAGLSISEGLRAQIGGYTVAARNAQDGISVVQTAEGALGEVHSNLQRLRDLAVQAANDSNNTESRDAIQAEADALVSEIGRISQSTNFNGIQLLQGDSVGDGTGLTSLSFQVGAGSSASNQIVVELAASDVSALANGTDGTLDALSFGSAADINAPGTGTLDVIDAAISSISTARSELGAYQNRFDTAINSINIAKENLSASESRIRDTDMASEMANFTRANILQQAGVSMLAQANSLPQSVLSLLG